VTGDQAIYALMIVVYLVLMLGVGAVFSRRMTTSQEFFKGGNAIPWWVSGLSQYMSGFSAYTFVAIAGLVYTKGVFGIVFCMMTPIVIAVGAHFFAHLWHRSGVTTPVEYLEQRFSVELRQLFAWLGMVMRTLGNGIRLAAFSILLSAMSGFPADAICIVAGAVTIIYTLMGGLWAVVITDVVQCIVLLIALVPLFILSLARVGGVHGLLEATPDGFLQLPAANSSEWLWLAAWFVLLWSDYNGGNWSLIQRYCCTPSEKGARRVGYLAAALNIPTIFLAMIPVLAARALNGSINHEQSFGWAAQELLPAALVGIVIAGMLAATMSSLSSEFNILAGIYTNDFFVRFLKRDANDRQIVLQARLATVGIGTVTTVLGLAVIHHDGGVFVFVQKMAAYVTIPMALPLLLGLVTKRTPAWGVALSVVFGICFSWIGVTVGQQISLSFDSASAGNIKVFAQVTATAFAVLTVYFATGKLFPVTGASREKVEQFFDSMNPIDNKSFPSSDSASRDVTFIIGVVVAVIGVVLVAVSPLPQNGDGKTIVLITGAVIVAAGSLLIITGKILGNSSTCS